MTTVFTSTEANQLKDTLDGVLTDDADGLEAGAVYKKYMEVGNMPDAYLDDLEWGGPGLLAEKPEGQEIASLAMREGFLKRYVPRVMAGKILITEEAMDDNKYPESINMSRHLKRSGILTREYDCALILARATNTSYVGGDNVTLANTAHTLPNGGTFSNMLGVASAPSRIALTNAVSQLMHYPGLDGLITPIQPKKVVFPSEQWGVWEGIMGSTLDPTPGNLAEINVIKKNYSGLQLVNVPFWTNTQTNWMIITDAEKGLRFLWKRKARTRTWVDNDNEVMKHSYSQRYATGWTNARAFLFSNA